MLSVALGHLKTLASKSDLVGYAWVDLVEFSSATTFIKFLHCANDGSITLKLNVWVSSIY